MADTKTIIEQAHSAFHKRGHRRCIRTNDARCELAQGSGGRQSCRKEEIRAYWTRQWGEFDPHVEPLAMTEEDGDKTRVRVHQLVITRRQPDSPRQN